MFFNEQGILRIDEVVADHPSWQKIMEDKIVTADELTEQANAVIALLKNLEERLDNDQKKLVESLLAEASVLFAAHHVYQLQQLSKA